MSTCTPIYGLPVVKGSDAPCDIDDWSCDFVAAVETQLDALDAVVAQTATTVPLVKVSTSEPLTYSTFPAVFSTTFETVLADTDNMFDSAFPDRITIRTSGLYQTCGFAWGTTTSGTDYGNIGLLLRAELSGAGVTTVWQENRQFSTNGLNFYLTTTAPYPFNAGDVVFLGQNTGAAPTGTITVAQVDFSMFWMGDL